MNDARPLLSQIARLKAELVAADKATREVLEWAANALDAAVAKEREACAALADRDAKGYGQFQDNERANASAGACRTLAKAIRARTTEAGQ